MRKVLTNCRECGARIKVYPTELDYPLCEECEEKEEVFFDDDED